MVTRMRVNVMFILGGTYGTSVLQMVKYYIKATYDMIGRSQSLCTTE